MKEDHKSFGFVASIHKVVHINDQIVLHSLDKNSYVMSRHTFSSKNPDETVIVRCYKFFFNDRAE